MTPDLKSAEMAEQDSGGVALVINGDSLAFALGPRLERTFLEVACMCNVSSILLRKFNCKLSNQPKYQDIMQQKNILNSKMFAGRDLLPCDPSPKSASG